MLAYPVRSRSTHPIGHQLLQTLCECARRNLSIYFKATVLRQRFDQRKGIQLDVGVAMRQPLQRRSNDIPCTVMKDIQDKPQRGVKNQLGWYSPLLALLLHLVA